MDVFWLSLSQLIGVIEMNLEQLEKLRLNMIESKNRFDQEGNKFALDNCGYRFGDIVEVNYYSHKGKMMKFNKISLTIDMWRSEYFAVLTGNVLKSDGTEGKNEGKHIVSLGKIEIK